MNGERIMRTQVDSNGTMTIPDRIRDRLGIRDGAEVEVNFDAEGRAYIERAEQKPEPAPDRIERLRGSLKTDMTTDEMMEFLRGKG